MRKTIRKKVYDTNTARLLGWTGGQRYFTSLYRKRNGEYFARISDEDGERLVPLSFQDAERIAGELGADMGTRKAAAFPNGKQQYIYLGASISPDAYRKFDSYCSRHGMTKRAVLERLIDGLED